MADSLTEPKKHLALDTDWMSAAGMVGLFIICSMFLAGSAMNIVRSRWSLEPITWHTWILLAMSVWCFVRVNERPIRFVSIIVAIGPLTRILLAGFHATTETRLANTAFLQVIDGMMYAGACLYVLWWFRSKIRHA